MPRLRRASGAVTPPGPVSNTVVNNRYRFRAALVFGVAVCLLAAWPFSAKAGPGDHRATIGTGSKVPAAYGLATSESHSPPCSQAAAYAMFYTFFPLADFIFFRGLDLGPVNEVFTRCQYRVFFDGEHFTFSEDDWILGGVVEFYDYAVSGVTRAEAIADIELVRDRVWLAKVQPNGSLGPAVEQRLMRTAYTDWNHSIFGVSVWQHRAFIRRLPPGDYVSTYVQTYPGEDDFVATVYLHILPR